MTQSDNQNTKFFNAHHSPVGAFATLTFGCKGPLGGMGLELRGPADAAVYVGVEDAETPGKFWALPFFAEREAGSVENEDYDVEGLSDFRRESAISSFEDSSITREMGASIDEWRAADLTFRVISPVRSIPDPAVDPAVASEEDLKEALVPSVAAELTIDNRAGTRARKAFFGYRGVDPISSMRVIRGDGWVGVGQGGNTAIASTDRDVYAGLAWEPEAILLPRHDSNLAFMLGNIGLLVGTVPAGEIRTFHFAIGFFREGTVTTGLETRYLYRRWFDRIEGVLSFTFDRISAWCEEGRRFDECLRSRLTAERALMLSHAIRSYFGSTQCLETRDGKPIWMVNEGEYRMMNTFDLTIDQAFFELALNPWTVRNVLDLYVDRYAYEDRVRFPGEETTHPGGLAFTHDMGVTNGFSEPGRSSYEQAGLRGCFSYMSSEELLNWVLCAGMYFFETRDRDWLESLLPVLKRAFESLKNRDHPIAGERNGMIGLDSDRCEGGYEITTYDSLDASLGQARNNSYLGVKCWAAYILLESLFQNLGCEDLAENAREMAELGTKTIAAAVQDGGRLPAIIGEPSVARIIPVIEGLVYPWACGLTAAGDEEAHLELRTVLAEHFRAVLDSGECRFADGGWRLSSTSRNSWLSKIYLCQSIAEQVLGEPPDADADAAHLGWLMDVDNRYFAWSDQMLAGKAVGSRYYPRGVTGILWLATNSRRPLSSVRHALFPGGDLEHSYKLTSTVASS